MQKVVDHLKLKYEQLKQVDPDTFDLAVIYLRIARKNLGVTASSPYEEMIESFPEAIRLAEADCK